MIERPTSWRVSRTGLAVLLTLATVSLVLGTWLYSIVG